MSRLRLAIGSALLAFAITSCGGPAEVEANRALNVPSVPDAVFEPSSSEEAPEPATFVDQTTPEPVLAAPEPSPNATDSTVSEPSDSSTMPGISDDIQGREVEAVEESEGAAIVSNPQSFEQPGVQVVTITGASFLADDEVAVLVCQLLGEPITFDTTSEDLIVRLMESSAVDICDIPRAVNVTADAEGNFSVSVTGEVGPTTIVFAGPVSGDYATLTPLYLVS